MPRQRWLVTDAEYEKIRRTPPKAAAAQPEPTRPAPDLQITANGPTARHLLDLLTKAGIGSMLPASRPAPNLEDRGAGAPPTAGEVTYVFADGSLVSATQQQLVRPLPYSVVGLVGGAEPLQWSTGMLVVFNYSASFIQALLVSSTGVVTQVTARGVPAQDVPVPMTEAQLRSLAEAIDREIQTGIERATA